MKLDVRVVHVDHSERVAEMGERERSGKSSGWRGGNCSSGANAPESGKTGSR